MILSWIALIYLIIAVIVYFTAPYNKDVPFVDRLVLSIFWLPILVWLLITNA